MKRKIYEKRKKRMSYAFLIFDLKVDASIEFLCKRDKPLFLKLKEKTVEEDNEKQHEANDNDHVLKSEDLHSTDISKLDSIGLDLEIAIVHVEVIDEVVLPGPVEGFESGIKVFMFAKNLGEVLLDHFEVHSVVLVVADVVTIESGE